MQGPMHNRFDLPWAYRHITWDIQLWWTLLLLSGMFGVMLTLEALGGKQYLVALGILLGTAATVLGGTSWIALVLIFVDMGVVL